jgi:hypothetical protein
MSWIKGGISTESSAIVQLRTSTTNALVSPYELRAPYLKSSLRTELLAGRDSAKELDARRGDMVINYVRVERFVSRELTSDA